MLRKSAFEVLALVWAPHTVSPLHGHGGSLCGVKVLCGSILEEVSCACGCGLGVGYLHPADSIIVSGGDDLRHRVVNLGDVSVTLHVYAEPLLGLDVEPMPSWVELPALADDPLVDDADTEVSLPPQSHHEVGSASRP